MPKVIFTVALDEVAALSADSAMRGAVCVLKTKPLGGFSLHPCKFRLVGSEFWWAVIREVKLAQGRKEGIGP